MTLHRAGFPGGPLVELRDLLARIPQARAAKDASTRPVAPRLRSEAFERRLLVSVFTDEEREYLASGVLLGRLATVGPDGTPHVVPTGFRYNPDTDTIDVGGHDFATRKKYRDVLRHPKLAFVVDDLVSVSPWRVRGIEIRGEADVLDTGGTELGRGFAPEMFRITPKRIVSWGLSEPMSFNARSVP